MFKGAKLNINGLELSGDEPISPRTQAFLDKNKMIVRQYDGFVEVSGSFCLKKTDIDAFLASKKAEDATAVAPKETHPKSDTGYCGFKKGFLNR